MPAVLDRIPVRVTDTVWAEEVERYAPASPAAERERAGFAEGVGLRQLARCEGTGEDRTRLAGLLKVYVPIGDRPASEMPWGFVLSPAAALYLALVAFGERHPHRAEVRSVYERAHRRLHGRYPDQ